MPTFKKKDNTMWLILPNGSEVSLEFLYKEVEELNKFQWELKKWVCEPALIDIKAKSVTKFHGQTYDKNSFDLISDGWSHDHCETCGARISEGDENNDYETEGYNSGGMWICKFCYGNFIKKNNLKENIKQFKIILK